MDEALIAHLADLSDEDITVAKAVLSAATRKRMSDGEFAYIDAHGGRHLPIGDATHVRDALARFDQTDFESVSAKDIARRRIAAAASRFSIAVDDHDADDVSKAEPVGYFVTISKADVVHGVIYGVVNQADLIDRQGDVVRPDELRKACWRFMDYLQSADRIEKAEELGTLVNDTHDFGDIPGAIVECWMADDNNWCIGFRPDDIEIAKAAARGEYTGWSIEGQGNAIKVTT